MKGQSSSPHLFNAIKKYDEKNFKVEVLYRGEDYNRKEKEYIQWYHSYNSKYGYNIDLGGENPPCYFGEKSSHHKLSDKEVKDIQEMFLQGIKAKEIQKKYFWISMCQINRINNGLRAYNPEFCYPLLSYTIPEEIVLKIINDIKQNVLTLKEIGKKYGYCKSAIVLINQGKTQLSRKLYKDIFPIRKNAKNKISKLH